VFQQVPLNIIESNTELISHYRRRRETNIYKADIQGITSNSVDSLETLSEGAKLALLAASPSFSKDQQLLVPNLADSFFNELAIKNLADSSHSRVKRYAFEPTDRINAIFGAYEQLASDYGRKNCHLFSEGQRRLPGDVIYTVPSQFESQAKLALSIAHFLSSFYQIINPEEDFPLRNAERAITEDQMFAEVISAIAADFRVFYCF
jgi:hypothetical protein